MTSPKPTRTRTIVVDAIALLESEHASTRDMLGMLLRMTEEGRNRERVIAVLAEDLWIHLQIEEELFYPAVGGGGSSLGEAPASRQALREALFQLERCPQDGAELMAAAKKLLALHDEDSAHEERLLFPRARRVLSRASLMALGERLRARRQELRESGVVSREARTIGPIRNRLGA